MARPNRSRTRIIEAAMRIAAADGVSATTMDAIAERAEVAKGSLYYNFASKDELFAEAFDEIGSHLLEELAASMEGRTGADALHGFVRQTLELLHAEDSLAAVLAPELLRSDRPWNDITTRLRDRLVELARQAMLLARPDLGEPDGGGAPVGHDDASIAAASVLGSILMTGVHWQRMRPGDALDAIANGLVRTLGAQRA